MWIHAYQPRYQLKFESFLEFVMNNLDNAFEIFARRPFGLKRTLLPAIVIQMAPGTRNQFQ